MPPKKRVVPRSSNEGSYSSRKLSDSTLLTTARFYVDKANSIAAGKGCYSKEIYYNALANYGHAFQLYDQLITVSETLGQSSTAIKNEYFDHLYIALRLIDKMIEECKIDEPQAMNVLMMAAHPKEKTGKITDDMKAPIRVATDADERDRAIRQQIINRISYDVCKYGSFEDYAGGKEFQNIFQREVINPLLFKNLSIESNKINGIFVYGPPGTGKSNLAGTVIGYLAKEKGKPATLIEISAGDIKGRFVGDTEKALRILFEEAKKEAETGRPVVLFFDEFDGLISEEDKGTSAVGEFKNLMQSTSADPKVIKNIIVIGATNNPEKIPRDGLSRFDKKIFLGLPGANEVRWLLQRQFKNVGWAGVDFLDDIFDSDEYGSIQIQRVDMDRQEFILQSKYPAEDLKIIAGAVANDLMIHMNTMIDLIIRPYSSNTLDNLLKIVNGKVSGVSILNDLVDKSTVSAFNDAGELLRGADLGALDAKITAFQKLFADFVSQARYHIMNGNSMPYLENLISQSFPATTDKTTTVQIFQAMAKRFDALDWMTMNIRSRRYAPREINALFKEMKGRAGEDMRMFLETDPDTGKVYFNKWLFRKRQVTKTRTIYSTGQCQYSKSYVTEAIPIHRTTFKETDIIKDEEKGKFGDLRKVAKGVDIEGTPFENLETFYLNATPLDGDKDISKRLGYTWGLKFKTNTAKTMIAPKFETDLEYPKDMYTKILVTRKVLKNTTTQKSAYMKGTPMTEAVEYKTVRQFKVPIGKDLDKEENKAYKEFAERIFSVQRSNDELEQSQKDGTLAGYLKSIRDEIDQTVQTKKYMPTTEDNVTAANIANSVTFAQLSLRYFETSAKYVRPLPIKNAQAIIDWAGGINQVLTLTGDKTPIEELLFDAALSGP